MHWTQTREGRAKMVLAQKRRWDRKRKQDREKQAEERSNSTPTRSLIKAEINELAKEGARVRLRQLEKEVVKLRVFLGEDGRDS